MATLISIDGSDCTGKTTLVGNLSDRLTSEGKRVKVIHFPRYETEVGKLILKHLSGEFKMDVGAFQYLYIADQMDYTRNEMFKDSENHDYIIFDRYKDSSLVYFMANRPRNFAMKDDLSFYSDSLDYAIEEGRSLVQAQCYICEPDLKIILHAEEGVLEERLNQKSKDVHESDFEFMKTVNFLYSQVAETFVQQRSTMTMDVTGKTEVEMLDHVHDFIKNKEK